MESESKLASDDRKGLGCLVLFGLVFFLAGCFPGFLVGKSLWQWQQAKSWVSVPATIESVDLQVHHDDSGGTTYSVDAGYSYDFEGRRYSSQRVGLHGGSDSFESYHRDLYQRLSRARNQNQPVPVWVDPEDPGDALIDRELRWGMLGFLGLFFVVFAGVGLGIIALGFWGVRKAKEARDLETAHADQPWLWREDWAQGFARSESKAGFWAAVVFATVWNLVSLPILFIVPGEVMDKGNWAALIGLLFPLVGVGLIIWALRLYLQRRRFGTSRLTLTTLPAPLGGVLEAELFSPKALPPNSLVEFTLSCIRRRTTGTGKNRSTRESVLWQDDREAHVAAESLLGTTVPVRFRIPGDRPPVGGSTSDSGGEIVWRLEARSAMPGVDYGSRFEVPVFELPGFDADEATADGNGLRRDAAMQSGLPGDPSRLGLIQSTDGHWLVPRARLRSAVFMTLLLVLVFAGSTVFLWLHAPIIFPLVSGLFALLIGWVALETMLRRSEVKARLGQLSWRRGLFSRGAWQHLSTSQISSLELKNAGSVNNRQILRAVVVTQDGKEQIIASQLLGRRHASAWLGQLRRRLGMQDSAD